MSSAPLPPLHDYDPAWDYPVVELNDLLCVSDDNRMAVMSLLQHAKDHLCPAMGFSQGFEAFFVAPSGLSDPCEDVLAVYCSGTSSRPVIGLDLFMMELETSRLGIDFLHQVQITIAHELGHAYQETLGIEPDAFCEDQVEVFGLSWVNLGIVDLGLLTRTTKGNVWTS